MRTLVIHLGGIGDFLLSCPALSGLRRCGPVDLLGKRERLEVAVDGGLADVAHDADACDLDTLFSTPSPRLQKFLAGYDRCVAWLRPDEVMLDAMCGCGVKQTHAYPGLPPAGWSRHASAYYLDCLDLEDPGPPRLSFQASEVMPDLDVVIQPGSGGRQKNWPLDDYRVVADELTGRGRQVAWCTGPAEEQMQGLQPSLPPMSLARLGRTLARARLYIGNDSGITHLAAASGCPTLAIFGPTNPTVWAPRGANVRVIQGKEGFPTAEEVLSASL
ncbi:MAG: glycosyltransferase family 9 protein [Candidatus Hydrogenedentes bacterium]|nr:glycosyltransferase family 9 protein [Candidatus Hydrogenedentota bacterium]